MEIVVILINDWLINIGIVQLIDLSKLQVQLKPRGFMGQAFSHAEIVCSEFNLLFK